MFSLDEPIKFKESLCVFYTESLQFIISLTSNLLLKMSNLKTQFKIFEIYFNEFWDLNSILFNMGPRVGPFFVKCFTPQFL